MTSFPLSLTRSPALSLALSLPFLLPLFCCFSFCFPSLFPSVFLCPSLPFSPSLLSLYLNSTPSLAPLSLTPPPLNSSPSNTSLSHSFTHNAWLWWQAFTHRLYAAASISCTTGAVRWMLTRALLWDGLMMMACLNMWSACMTSVAMRNSPKAFNMSGSSGSKYMACCRSFLAYK